jgi:hypothetical protein
MTERELVVGFLMALFGGAGSAWSLYKRHQESRRLLEIDKYWRPLKQDEQESGRLEKIKRRLILGYTVFLCMSIVICAYLGFKIATIQGWF